MVADFEWKRKGNWESLSRALLILEEATILQPLVKRWKYGSCDDTSSYPFLTKLMLLPPISILNPH